MRDLRHRHYFLNFAPNHLICLEKPAIVLAGSPPAVSLSSPSVCPQPASWLSFVICPLTSCHSLPWGNPGFFQTHRCLVSTRLRQTPSLSPQNISWIVPSLPFSFGKDLLAKNTCWSGLLPSLRAHCSDKKLLSPPASDSSSRSAEFWKWNDPWCRKRKVILREHTNVKFIWSLTLNLLKRTPIRTILTKCVFVSLLAWFEFHTRLNHLNFHLHVSEWRSNSWMMGCVYSVALSIPSTLPRVLWTAKHLDIMVPWWFS